MRFSIIAILASVAVASASTIPHVHAEINTSPVPRSILEARDSYDCAGSSMCKSLQVKFCDQAANNNLIRNNDINYGAPGSGRAHTGACEAVFGGYGCGIFIQGDKTCARSGNDMWWDYQDIRKNGCHVCGSKHWGNGCLTTVNYVSSC